jgi:hypothetical protein
MTKPTQSDRRTAARIPAAIPIEIRDGRGFSLHSSSDISTGGAFFDRSIPNPVGSKVTVSLLLPGEKPIVCDAEVVNVPDRRNFGMGVRFLNMSAIDQKRLESFTSKIGPSK